MGHGRFRTFFGYNAAEPYINMADAMNIVLCDVLCFVRNKFVNTNVKVLKSTLLDFYSVEDISSAKKRLLDDICAIRTEVKFPHTPQRRDGGDRFIREVDDIVAIFSCLDENKLLDKLPKYVANGPDTLPSVRLYEGELGGLLAVISKMNDKIHEYGEAIAILTGELRALQSKVQPPSAAAMPASQQPHRPRLPPDPSASTMSLLDFPPLGSAAGLAARSADSVVNQPSMRNDWAASVSTPLVHANQFAVLQSADDEEQSDAGDAGRPFTVVTSRRLKRLRNRTTPSSSQQNTANTANPPRRTSTVIGKSTATSHNITAAKQIRKKSVWCIDNLNTSCSVQDISKYVSEQLFISVLSCFETKSRRRRGETTTDDRKAFRLCIYEEDSVRLLDSSVWPHSVMVSQWFFKTQSGDDKRLRLEDGAGVAVAGQSSDARRPTAPADQVCQEVNADDNDNDNDDTILNAMECHNDGV